MKTPIIRLTTAAVVAALACGFAAAQTATPVVKERQENQAARIQQGVNSGQLTAKETATLKTEQRAIRAEKKAFKADGKVTAAERAKLRQDQNRASRDIYRKKHNARKAA